MASLKTEVIISMVLFLSGVCAALLCMILDVAEVISLYYIFGNAANNNHT